MNPHRRRSIIELTLVFLTAAGHVALELSVDGWQGAAATLDRPQHLYNLVAAAAWGGYLLWRVLRRRETAREWGFTTRNFRTAFRSSLLLGLLASLPLLAWGMAMDRFPLPPTFWLVVMLYPLWGIAQQFVLQSLVTANLRPWLSSRFLLALAAASLFSLAHTPNAPLMGLTFFAGLAFTWLFDVHRNLWPVGIAHGFLGALAYYVVLGQDPGADLLRLWAGL